MHQTDADATVLVRLECAVSNAQRQARYASLLAATARLERCLLRRLAGSVGVWRCLAAARATEQRQQELAAAAARRAGAAGFLAHAAGSPARRRLRAGLRALRAAP